MYKIKNIKTGKYFCKSKKDAKMWSASGDLMTKKVLKQNIKYIKNNEEINKEDIEIITFEVILTGRSNIF